MIVELINTGAELLLGRVLNSHQQWLGRRFADLGYTVARQVTVSDAAAEIERAVRESLSRADLIITTGGLGPTSDDVTRDVVARLLGKPLREDETVLAHIRSFFVQRGRPMPASTRVQALVPEGATVLPNPNGTAPGLLLKVDPNPVRGGDARTSWLVMLPGPPRELKPMFNDVIVPWLVSALPVEKRFFCRTLRTIGIGESVLEEKISGPLQRLVEAGLELGYCARPGRVDVRLVARGSNATEQVASGEAIVRSQLSAEIFGCDDDDLETIVVNALIEQKRTLALAESCTGGCIADRVTDVPGASAVFLAGFVTYSNAAKEKFLGVRAGTLAEHGAVSEAVALEMAAGARRAAGADYGLSVTGIAGPSGGTSEKPVGTVCIGLASATEMAAWRFFHPLDRRTFKEVTAARALNQLRLFLKKFP